jgi:hypothetical protein
MRRQLRPFYTDEELAGVYPAMYDHTRWDDHVKRVSQTVDIVMRWGAGRKWFDGIDLTCGDGAILRALQANGTVQTTYYGDLVHADHLDVIGKVEDTMSGELLMDKWDLYICSETLEHVQDPDTLLRNARALARNAVFTTPIDETPEYGNPEHYWGWGLEDIHDMLVDAGWSPEPAVVLDLPFYKFQVWCCS